MFKYLLSFSELNGRHFLINRNELKVICMFGRFWGILRSVKVICNAERAVIDFVSILGSFAFIAL